jgi:autotransporter-associated beta strand protein
LTLSGTFAGAQALTFSGAGTINLSGSLSTSPSTMTQVGTGMVNLLSANTLFVGALTVSGGTFAVSGSGATGATGAVTVNPGATLLLDNSGTVVANRLGTSRAITLFGGNLTLNGGATSVTETFGAPTFNRGQSTITINPGAGGGTLQFTAAPVLATAGANTVLFRGTNLTSGTVGAGTASIIDTAGFTLVGSGTANTTIKGILPWALVDCSATGFGATGIGSSFATTDSAAETTGTVGAIWRPLSTTEYGTTLVSGNNVVLSSGVALSTGTLALNSLTLNSGGGVSLQATQTLTISSGGLLLQDGNSGISGGILSSGATSLWVFTPSNTGATSSISSALTGTFALTKSGAGTLVLGGTSAGFPTLSANTFTGTTTINEGTLRLGAGNALGVLGTQALVLNGGGVNGTGGVLDLNGQFLLVGALSNQGAGANAAVGGGVIMSTSAGSGTFVTNTATATSFGGGITGDSVFFSKTGTGVLTMLGASSFGGGLLLNGGGITLRDYGTMSGSGTITVMGRNSAFSDSGSSARPM